jgi:hypothetical protein
VGLLDYFRRRADPLADATAARPRGALVASAAVVTPEQGKALATRGRNRRWQTASFVYRRELPEVGYVMRFLGHNSTHIRLFVGERRRGADDVIELDDSYGWLDEDTPDPDALPWDLVDAAREALTQLTGNSPSGGGAAVLSPVVQAFEGPGECWLVGRYDPDTDTETWGVHSISEVSFHTGRLPGADDTGEGAVRGFYRLTTGEGTGAAKTDLDPATTTCTRLWTADPEWSAEPDSPMRTLRGTCERLLLIDKANDAALRSRASGNGVIIMPEEVSSVPVGDEEEPGEDELMQDFTTQLVTPLSQDGSAASVVPMILRGPYQYLDLIRHLTLDRPLDPKLAELETRLLARLGIGMDVPPEVVTGYADVNHWNVWQVDADTFKHHQEPITIAAVEALTLGYLRHRLTVAVELGVAAWTPEQIARLLIWYDPASLVSEPDMRAAANDAFDRDTISARAHRRYLGMDESDAPDAAAASAEVPVGETGMLAPQLSAIADIAGSLLRAGYVPDAVSAALGLNIAHSGLVPVTVKAPEAPIPAAPAAEPPALPPGQDSGGPPIVGAGGAAPPTRRGRPTEAQRRLSRRLMDIDRRLRERVTAAADAALARALERAGNRVRSAAQRDEAARTASAGLPGERVPATLGRALIAALGMDERALLAEAFDRLHGQWTEWTQAAAAEAIDTAARISGLSRGDPNVMRAVAELRDRFAEAAETAWPALHDGLNELATDLMYQPDPALPDVGELADGAVHPGLVRQALAVAGGMAADATGAPPLSGLTSGALLGSFLRDNGAVPVEYEWAYGISSRPFPPHQHLDGLVFTDFADPALSTAGTGGGWVGGSFIPGDHKGCHCDYAVIYADGNTRDELDAIGRRAYEEQKPGKPVPGWEATLDPKVRREGYARPPVRRSPAADAAEAARTAPAPAPLPAGVTPDPPPAPTGQRVKRPTYDDAGVPWVLDHDYLSNLDAAELDDLTDHAAATMGDLDPRAERRWADLEAFLEHREARAELQEQLIDRGDLQWAELTRRLDAFDAAQGRAGLTHPRVGGRPRPAARTGPTHAEVAEEYALWLENEWVAAEGEVRGELLNRAGQARGIDPRNLFTGDIRVVYRYASDELLDYWQVNQRITWTEYYYERTGNPNFAAAAARHRAANASISRDRLKSKEV